MRHAANLWSFGGKISRTGYLFAGFLLFVIKFGLDVAVSMRFGRDWSPLMYLSPKLHPMWAVGPIPRGYMTALLIVAAPFAWAGVSLSARRLRDMGVHPFWAGLFFLPFLHWAFFAVLAVAPPRAGNAPVDAQDPYREIEPAPPSRPVSLLERIVPRTKTGAFLFGTSASLLLGVICFVISVKLDKSYGFTLFVGVPFAMGFICGFSTTVGTRAGLGASIGTPSATGNGGRTRFSTRSICGCSTT